MRRYHAARKDLCLTSSLQIVAYGDAQAADSIKYSGTEVPLVKEHPKILREIQETLEQKLQTRFNHSMLNRYKDGSVHIGSHSDNLGVLSRFYCSMTMLAAGFPAGYFRI